MINNAPALKRFVYNDGGRVAAGFNGITGACACRAIAIATGKPYREVHDDLNALCALFGEPLNTLRIAQGRRCQRASADTSIPGCVARRYLESLGWRWILSGARLHRCDLPSGRLVVQLTRHFVTLIDNVVHDHGEYWRGRRVVYGYYTPNRTLGDLVWKMS
jgi:hypothetical protein